MTDRFPHPVMADELDKLAYSKATWLSDFAQGRSARPQHEIETKQREMAVIRQAAGDYRRAANREDAA